MNVDIGTEAAQIPRKGINKWDFRCSAEECKAVKPWSWWTIDVKGKCLESLRAVPSELTRLEGRRETMGPCWGRGGTAPPPGSPVEVERRKSCDTASCFHPLTIAHWCGTDFYRMQISTVLWYVKMYMYLIFYFVVCLFSFLAFKRQ
jgi:hypothetical protein